MSFSRVDIGSRHYAFVNVGESEHRNWDDCRKYGFLAAGGFDKAGHPRYAQQLKDLRVGQMIFASISRTGSDYKGFVGYWRDCRGGATD